MTSPKELFNELTYLTEVYLLQEHKLSDWIYAEPESYAFFKQLATSQKKQVTPPPPLPAIKTEQTTAAQEPEVKPKDADKLIKLEPMEPHKPVDFSDIRAILQEKVPNLNIVAEPQRKVKEAILLTLSPSPAHQAFLVNFAQAIELCLCPIAIVNAAKIESVKGWDNLLNQPGLKIVLMLQPDLEQLPHLAKHYVPAKSPALGKVPAFFLPDIALLLKEPIRKHSLWTALESVFPAAAHG